MKFKNRRSFKSATNVATSVITTPTTVSNRDIKTLSSRLDIGGSQTYFPYPNKSVSNLK